MSRPDPSPADPSRVGAAPGSPHIPPEWIGRTMIEFFDRKGQPAAFCHDGRSIYLWNGRAVAILEDDAVFAYGGQHIGWLDDGWIRDAEGKCLLYEADAIRGPAKPQRGARTFPGARGLRPARGELQAVPMRPARSEIWSDRTFLDLI